MKTAMSRLLRFADAMPRVASHVRNASALSVEPQDRVGRVSKRSTPLGVLAILCGVTLSSGAFAACDQTLKFGVADPLTGPSATFGIDQIQALKWAVEDINAAGGVNGCKLEAIIVDNQGKPDVAITTTNRFVQIDKVPVIVTAFSSVVKAVAPIANREKVLLLSIGANSPSLAHMGDYVYTSFPLADVDMKALASFMTNKQGKKRAAVLYVNNETGIDGSQVFRDSFKADGGEVVLYDSYEENQSDFTGLALKVRSTNPDMIHIHSVVSDFPAIVSQLRQLGINTQVTSFQTAFNTKMIKDLGAASEGIIVTSLAPSVEANPALVPYLKRWQDEYKRPPNGLPYTQYWYDSAYIVADLYRWLAANKLPATGENMRKALLAIKTFKQPLSGTVTFNENHTVQKETYFWQVKGGQFVLVGKN
jgi:branched-chain amino acid transport system substrate-binding protein